MVDAVRYVVDNGAKWRAVPADFPWWRAVYDFFRRWCRHGYVRELYQRLRRTGRQRQARPAEPSAAIIDSQSVDGADTVTGDSRGYDGAKSRDGRKRHILTETLGLLLEVSVTPANVHDSMAAPDLLTRFMAEPGRRLKLAWADSAYQGPALAQAFARHGVKDEVVRRSDGQRGFVVLARRPPNAAGVTDVESSTLDCNDSDPGPVSTGRVGLSPSSASARITCSRAMRACSTRRRAAAACSSASRTASSQDSRSSRARASRHSSRAITDGTAHLPADSINHPLTAPPRPPPHPNNQKTPAHRARAWFTTTL